MASVSKKSGVVRVQIVSDFHGELNPDRLPSPKDLETGADVVVLAGDTARAPDAVAMACDLFPAAECLVLVAGNHEHYRTGQSIDDGIREMKRQAMALSASTGTTIAVLEDEEVIVSVRSVDVRFLGATLWTDFALFGDPVRDRVSVYNGLNDYRCILGSKVGLLSSFLGGEPRPLDTAEVLDRHEASRAFLLGALEREHDGPTVVVTHHLPSLRSVATRWKRSGLSAGFASNMDDLVGKGATLWVHGHTHDSCMWRAPEKGTLVVCNPQGYVRSSPENQKFDPRLVIDIRKGPNQEWRAGRERQRTPRAAGVVG